MDKQLNFYQYISDISILVIRPNGKLERLFCPFMVYLKRASTFNPPLLVSRIIKEDDNSIFYVVDSKPEPHSKYYIAYA